MKYNCQPARSLTSKLSIPLLASLVSPGLFLSGCAAVGNAPARISPTVYESYDCDQIAAEAHLTLNYLKSFDLRCNATPACGPKKEQQEQEYRLLKSEFFALQRAAIQKKCPMDPAVLPVIPDSAPEKTGNRDHGEFQFRHQ
ncbi:hypothetical protein AGMMS50256_34330 [Betaproteobacteria bacterium]|nr:hypothetical protein AGMMS50256_34330 [Betaproteobacteria bacterium]